VAGLTPKKRDGWWWAYGSIRGRRVRKSLGTRDRREAKERCEDLEKREWARVSDGDKAVRTFAEAVIAYIEGGGDKSYLTPLIHHFHGRLVNEITPGEIEAAARLLLPKAGPATRNRKVITPARAVINFASRLNWCSPIRVKHFTVEKPKRTFVDRSWIDAFVDQCDKDSLPHLAAIMLFMFQTGTRISEACRVMPEDVDIQKRTIILERTKTERYRTTYITEELVARIEALGTIEGAPLFRYADRFGPRNRMRAVCRRAGITFVSPHQAGRHSFATNALKMGATLKDAMEAGGWKSSKQFLETYAHSEQAGRITSDLFDAQAKKGSKKRAQN